MNTSINLEILLTPEAPCTLMEIDGYFVTVPPNSSFDSLFIIDIFAFKSGSRNCNWPCVTGVLPWTPWARVAFRKSMFEWELVFHPTPFFNLNMTFSWLEVFLFSLKDTWLYDFIQQCKFCIIPQCEWARISIIESGLNKILDQNGCLILVHVWFSLWWASCRAPWTLTVTQALGKTCNDRLTHITTKCIREWLLMQQVCHVK